MHALEIDYSNFTGCLSNIIINGRKLSKYHIKYNENIGIIRILFKMIVLNNIFYKLCS